MRNESACIVPEMENAYNSPPPFESCRTSRSVTCQYSRMWNSEPPGLAPLRLFPRFPATPQAWPEHQEPLSDFDPAALDPHEKPKCEEPQMMASVRNATVDRRDLDGIGVRRWPLMMARVSRPRSTAYDRM